MAYFIFLKNQDNNEGTLNCIVENYSDLNNLNINQTDYKIIEDIQENFDAVKYGIKITLKYNDNTITYKNITTTFLKKEDLIYYIENFKSRIKQFTNNNLDHILFNRWNDYYNQLNNFNVDNITFPLNKSLEQYFNDLEQPSYNILQIP